MSPVLFLLWNVNISPVEKVHINVLFLTSEILLKLHPSDPLQSQQMLKSSCFICGGQEESCRSSGIRVEKPDIPFPFWILGNIQHDKTDWRCATNVTEILSVLIKPSHQILLWSLGAVNSRVRGWNVSHPRWKYTHNYWS